MAYVHPVRNRLRSLPVRQYQSPLPSKLPGLAGLRGLGQALNVATVDAAGNEWDANGNFLGNVNFQTTVPVPVPSTTTLSPSVTGTISTTPGVALTNPPGGPYPVGTSAASLTSWLNTNSSTVLWIGGIALAVLLLSRLGR